MRGFLMEEEECMGIMMKRILTSIFGLVTLAFTSTVAPIASQQTVQIPEPDLSAFPLPIVKVSVKEIANYPIDPLLTNFKSLKQHIDTTVLLVGDHIFFANDKAVYRLTKGVKRTLVFDAPLFKVITDWKSRVFVMTKTRWVYVYDLNSLKRLSSFQVKYAQNPSEFAYLSDDVLLIGFDLWKDQARKNRNPVAAATYGMNGVERWKIQNTAKIFSDSDERHSFEVLQVGRRSFVANCCSYPVQKNTYEQNIKTAFLYENKTGKLRIAEIKTPDSVLPNPNYLNIDNPDLFTYHQFTILDMFNYYYLSNSDLILPNDDEKLSKIFSKCDFFGQEYNRLLFKNYIIFSLYNHCGGKIGFFDRKSKDFLEYESNENCMYQTEDSHRSFEITLVSSKNFMFFIDPFTYSVTKINKNNQIESKCIYKFDKNLIRSTDWDNLTINSHTFSSKNATISISDGNSQPRKVITLGFDEKSEEILFLEQYISLLSKDYGINVSLDGNLRYYGVIK
jgi:hypothetical protein